MMLFSSPEIILYLAQEFPEIMAKVDMFNQMSSFQGETQRKESRLIATDSCQQVVRS